MADTSAQSPRMSRTDEIIARHERLLGPEIMAEIRASVAAAPPPSPELIDQLRRIFLNPAGEIP